MTNIALCRASLALALTVACGAVTAQTSTAVDTTTRSLGGGAGSGKILTREELRACLKQQASLTTRRAEAESSQSSLKGEKQSLESEQDALKTDRANAEAATKAVVDLNTRFKDYGARVAAYNERVKSLDDPMGRAGDRAVVERQGKALKAEQEELEGERAKLADSQKSVDAFNAKAKALEQKATDWNQRNAEVVKSANAVNVDNDRWLADCGDRRYREDDEIAIKRGK